MQTYIVMVSGSILNLSTHLTPHMTLSIETCIGPLNTGFSISLFPFSFPTSHPRVESFQYTLLFKNISLKGLRGEGERRSKMQAHVIIKAHVTVRSANLVTSWV